MRTGVEITVLLHGMVVNSRWVTRESGLTAGDSHLFDVLFPLDFTDPAPGPHLEDQGFVVKPVRGVHSVGVRLFSMEADGKRELRVPAGVPVRMESASGGSTIDGAAHYLEAGDGGEIHGRDGWVLRFAVTSIPAVTVPRRTIHSAFYLQSILFGFVFVVGLLALGFFDHQPFKWEDLVPQRRHRMAVMQMVPSKRARPPRIEDPVTDRIAQLRIAPRKQSAPVPRPRASRPSALQLRTAPSRTALSPLAHTDHVFDLTEEEGEPIEPDAVPTLDDPGSLVPAVPVAPPPAMAPPPPPPMPPPEPPPQEATPPKRLSFPAVDYPAGARHLGIEGRVRLLLHIDAKGSVYKVDVLAGLHPLLDRAAVAAARQARYEPAKDTRGRPMASTATVTVRFELEDF